MYRSRKALADMSYFRQLAKCCRMDSIVCRGCWRVIRRNFCSGLAMLGKIDWAASYGSMGLDGPAIKNDIMRQFFGELLCIALHHYLLWICLAWQNTVGKNILKKVKKPKKKLDFTRKMFDFSCHKRVFLFSKNYKNEIKLCEFCPLCIFVLFPRSLFFCTVHIEYSRFIAIWNTENAHKLSFTRSENWIFGGKKGETKK